MSIELALRVASQMLGTSSLDPELERRIRRTHDLVVSAKPEGVLNSSQVIASIVEEWERERRLADENLFNCLE